ncbi:hypothetical protein [Kutzneria sp. CA-103260]|uniref:hypothetical protein n=1 Tax=Kutzneria sp. CA-103260 TaxID=2802641 RepID=UPI001BA4E8B2|nr:hypothetical protein [Kutzneria sp. CA-103260]QUQ72248.1 hypothetical protein JJ691_100360 [Kutzneria sp. CA-103260]
MYRLDVYPEAQEQIDALPPEAVPGLAEVFRVLELAPWNGDSQHDKNPTAEVRKWKFGPHAAGQVIYLILDHQREVHIVMVQWWG